ncbi:MAG: glutaredoxin family protein [Solirubrobacterales bacterium]
MNAQLVLYTRPDCHLCEQALEELVALHGEGYRFELHEVDIESDEELLRGMLERIPVLELNGEVVAELVVDQTSVRARLDTVGADDRGGRGGA